MQKAERKCQVCAMIWTESIENKHEILCCPQGINEVHQQGFFICEKCSTSDVPDGKVIIDFFIKIKPITNPNKQIVFIHNYCKIDKISLECVFVFDILLQYEYIHKDKYQKIYQTLETNAKCTVERLEHEYDIIQKKKKITDNHQKILSKMIDEATEQINEIEFYPDLSKYIKQLESIILTIDNLKESSHPQDIKTFLHNLGSDVGEQSENQQVF